MDAQVHYGEGHNSIGVDAETFNKHVALIGQAEAELAVVREKLKKRRKAAKADGVMLGLFDAMRKLADLPREEQQQQLAHTEAYLRYLRAPVGAQFTLDLEGAGDGFDNANDEEVNERVVEEARAAGWRAGLEGKLWIDDNPHDPSAPIGQAWLEEYHKGQAKATEALAEDAPEPDRGKSKSKGKGKK